MSGTTPAMTKEEATAKVSNMDRDKRSQQAIVDLMIGKGKIEKVVHQIPGGAHMTEQLDSESLKNAVFTWLRRVRDFDRFEISFIGDYETEDQLKDKGIKPRKVKFHDFNYKAGAPLYWRKKGITELANVVTNAINETEDIVSIIIDREGIFVINDLSKDKFGPQHSDWNPSLLIHKVR